MQDFFNQIYNGFLLRDLLGYFVPGTVVIVCCLHLTSVLLGQDFVLLLQSLGSSSITYILLAAACYAGGHFISGVFFHTPFFRRVFSYSPKIEVLTGSKHGDFNAAWAQHRADYQAACNEENEKAQIHIERHAALIHFTGHFSAAIVVLCFYLVFLHFYAVVEGALLLAIPAAILFFGIYRHYRQLTNERFMLETRLIEISDRQGAIETSRIPNA
ncbi:hypothetical protein [Aliiroseovarius sp.]|uniref:hypothetical protein n=1 Tax=Aliiroseovarius sp. TaxID=1872442 RepID=UPI003BAA0592